MSLKVLLIAIGGGLVSVLFEEYADIPHLAGMIGCWELQPEH